MQSFKRPFGRILGGGGGNVKYFWFKRTLVLFYYRVFLIWQMEITYVNHSKLHLVPTEEKQLFSAFHWWITFILNH